MKKDTAEKIINDDGFRKAFHAALNAEMQAAAEPLIQQALSDIEKQMRTKLAKHLIALLDTNYSMHRNGTDLVIRVNQTVEDKDRR